MIEQKLETLTEAVNALIEVMKSQNTETEVSTPVASAPIPTPTPLPAASYLAGKIKDLAEVSTPVASAPTPTPTPTPTLVTTPEPKPGAAPAEATTKKDLQSLLTQVATTSGRETMLRIFEEHAAGAKLLSQVDPAHFDAIANACKTALATAQTEAA